MTSTRRTALWAGIWFAVTFITSILAAALYGGFGRVLTNTHYILGGDAARIQWGAFLVSDDVVRATPDDGIRYRDLGPVELDGLERPVRLFQAVVGEEPAAQPGDV